MYGFHVLQVSNSVCKNVEFCPSVLILPNLLGSVHGCAESVKFGTWCTESASFGINYAESDRFGVDYAEFDRFGVGDAESVRFGDDRIRVGSVYA